MELKTLTVSEVNSYIKRVLQYDPILNNVTVKGEISNFKLHNSGHCYFSVKDRDSKIKCVMFRNDFYRVNFKPADGMNVKLKGNVSVYERNGEYQLYVRDMEEDGLGRLHIEFERLKKELNDKGYFNPLLKKDILKYPKKIGVITSATGAAIRDIISVIKRRCNIVDVVVIPVLVQGEMAAGQISSAIDLLNNRDDIDTIIVSRGGGSIEELWAFNELVVVESIYDSEIPVISAVGHETDFTLSDFVSDLRAPTPSAAGELSVPHKDDLRLDLKHQLTKLVGHSNRKLVMARNDIQLYTPENMVRQLKYNINDSYQSLDFMYSKIDMLIKNKIKDKANELQGYGIKLDQLSPLKTLNRGYTIATKQDGTNIRSVNELNTQDKVDIILKDGRAKLTVDSLEKGDLSLNE